MSVRDTVNTPPIMSELIKIIIASAGFSAMFSAAIIWLFKSWISERLKNAIAHEYAQKLETHKAQLQAASGIELEQLKSKLQIAASERNIKLTTVFETQAEVVATTYKNLIILRDNVFAAVISSPVTDEKAAHAIEESRRMFYVHFLQHEIYIPKATAKAVLDFAQKLYSAKAQYECHMRQPPNPQTASQLQDTLNTLYKEIPRLLELLKDDFQKILGFPLPDKGEAVK